MQGRPGQFRVLAEPAPNGKLVLSIHLVQLGQDLQPAAYDPVPSVIVHETVEGLRQVTAAIGEALLNPVLLKSALPPLGAPVSARPEQAGEPA